ncbi:hypothetical protein BZA05DRAFT_439457 [Tricharina praecox]|uniref:uncharacterized protein n=1 Tax=Tricharina praecox TaxID=43433 RepID=UPI00221FC1C5|nr:uncharacterized protein BZA05DRAFT_439457 [Tricharina praecox]KAI5842691.1 hypothetical protein BZA05DRAFT_439457 [Tricharina praecox]
MGASIPNRRKPTVLGVGLGLVPPRATTESGRPFVRTERSILAAGCDCTVDHWLSSPCTHIAGSPPPSPPRDRWRLVAVHLLLTKSAFLVGVPTAHCRQSFKLELHATYALGSTHISTYAKRPFHESPSPGSLNIWQKGHRDSRLDEGLENRVTAMYMVLGYWQCRVSAAAMVFGNN